MSWQFLKSGWLKLTTWDTTLELFKSEYQVPLLSPTLAAVAGTAGELFFPALLILGLLTRVGALGLFAVNLLAVVSYWHVLGQDGYEAALAQHVLWGYMLVVLATCGAGRLLAGPCCSRSVRPSGRCPLTNCIAYARRQLASHTRRMSEAGSRDELHSLAARLTTAHGAGMFPAMAQYLGAMLHAEEVLIGEAVDEHHAQTLGVSINGAAQPNYQFPLAGTPYEALIRTETDTPNEAVRSGTGQPRTATAPPMIPATSACALHDAPAAIMGFVCARSAAALPITEHQHCLIEIVAVLLTTELQLMRSQRERSALDSQVHRLRAELDAVERVEITAAVTGRHELLAATPPPIDLDDTTATGLHHVQREHILRVLNATRWVIEGNSGAALKLGMKPATLRHRMKKLGIARATRHP